MNQMIDLNLLNEAAFDTELTDTEFRMLYIIANNASLHNAKTVKIHNGFLMDKLDLCERQVIRLTKSLNKKKYVVKRGNVYTIKGDKNVSKKTDINGDKNVTPKKNKKENIKNIYSTCTSTGTSDYSYIIQSNDVNNINSNELNNMVSGVTYCDGESNNDKKENEMSDNGTNAMNAIEAKENESSGCDTENEMITSTSAEENNSSMGDYNVNGQNPTESSNLLAAAPTREEITALKEKIWQIKDKKDYADFKPYLDRFIDLMNKYKTAYPNDSNFIQTMRNWYKNSLQYFPKNEVSQQELLILNYHLESLRLADTVEKLNNAILRIDGWIQKVEQQHRMTKELMNQITKYTEREAQNNKTIWQEWSEKLNQAS